MDEHIMNFFDSISRHDIVEVFENQTKLYA